MHILTPNQIDNFIRDGFLRIDDAFSAETVTAAREILWQRLRVRSPTTAPHGQSR